MGRRENERKRRSTGGLNPLSSTLTTATENRGNPVKTHAYRRRRFVVASPIDPVFGESEMNKGKHGANAITIAETEYLLAGGNETHLVAETSDAGQGRPAISSHRFEAKEAWQSAYAIEELQEPRWSPKTICGRDWQSMELGDGPTWDLSREPVYAPSCRSCLRIASRGLSSRPPDDRIPLVAALAVQEVVETSFARVDGVPGDQAEALRAAIRKELRRHGLRGRTYLLRTTVFVSSDDAWDALSTSEQEAFRDGAADAIERAIFDEASSPQPREISWDTWGVI